METKRNQKKFDAVKMMHEIRDKISQDTQNISFEQLKEYIKAKLTENNSKLVGQKLKPRPIVE